MNPLFVVHQYVVSGLETVVKNVWKQFWAFVSQFFAWYPQGAQRGLYDIGFPEDYGLGIDKRWRELLGFWVVRNHEGICVMMEGERDPWVWPLVRVGVVRDETGRMWVDLGKRFYYEKDEWQNVEAFLYLNEKHTAEKWVRSIEERD
jgi:hypothetical protein